MTIQIVRKQAVHVVGLSIDVSLKDAQGAELIPNLFRRFKERIHEVENKTNPMTLIGVFIDPPDYDPEKDTFEWIAGVEVEDVASIPQGMTGKTFEARDYAVNHYAGKMKNGNRAYGELYQWINESPDYQLSGTYGIEILEKQMVDLNPEDEIQMDLYFPVEKNKSAVNPNNPR